MEGREELPGPLELKAVPDDDLDAAVEIGVDYVGDAPADIVRWRAARPDCFRGAFLDGSLVGVCYGVEKEPGRDELKAIGVLDAHWRRGIGSRLIADYEAAAHRHGIVEVSLGSAPDEPTERFYLKNGYRPSNLLVWRRGGGEEGKRYQRVEAYDPVQREALQAAHPDAQVIYIFVKRIG